MANDFYTPSGNPQSNAPGSSLTIRAEFLAIQAAFDKLPALMTHAGRLVMVSAAGTEMVGTTAITVDPATSNVGIGGALSVTGAITALAGDNQLGNAYNHRTYFGSLNGGWIRGSGEGYLSLETPTVGTNLSIILNAAAGTGPVAVQGGTFTFNTNAVWHAGNFNPAGYSTTSHTHTGVTAIYSGGPGAINTGRNVWGPNLYCFDAYGDPNAPTTYIAGLGFGGSGQAEIAVEWGSGVAGGGMWYRALRDVSDPWTGWTRLLDYTNYSGVVVALSGANMSGPLSATRLWTGYDSGQAGAVSCNNWFRSGGQTGWYSEDYASGIYAVETGYVDVYNDATLRSTKSKNPAATTPGSFEVANSGGTGDGNMALLTFHCTGQHATHLGLRADGYFGFGGWSRGSWQWYLDPSANMVTAGNVTAYSDERLKKDWGALPADFVERLAAVKHGTYTRIDTGARQVGVSAQSLQPLMPEAVTTGEDGDTLTVSYGNAALAAAVALAQRVLRLERCLAALIG
jgi:hypothetical protein